MVNNQMKNLFYSVIGPHTGEKVDKIIDRKQSEIEKCGYCLWSASIDKLSKKQAWKLGENDELYVLCKVSKDAKDPTESYEIVRADFMTYFDKNSVINKVEIPEGINTTFSGNNNYQAYKVKDILVLGEEELFDFGKYYSVTNEVGLKPFKVSFDGGEFKNSKGEILRRKPHRQFQNVFGNLNEAYAEKCERPIKVLFKLQYPFVVDLEV